MFPIQSCPLTGLCHSDLKTGSPDTVVAMRLAPWYFGRWVELPSFAFLVLGNSLPFVQSGQSRNEILVRSRLEWDRDSLNGLGDLVYLYSNLGVSIAHKDSLFFFYFRPLLQEKLSFGLHTLLLRFYCQLCSVPRSLP